MGIVRAAATKNQNTDISDFRFQSSDSRRSIAIECQDVVVFLSNLCHDYVMRRRVARADCKKPAPPKDYLKRLRRHQSRPISAAAAKALRDDNRSER